MPTTAPLFADQTRTWQLVQLAVLAAGGVLVVALLVVPAPALSLFWNGVLPLLPASFLITPIAWRSVCPLATLNVLASRRASGRRLSAAPDRWMGWAAIAGLALLVPARPLLFNTNGVAFAALLCTAGALAIVAGRREESRAGFCNSLCPILPVERLYGMDPLLPLRSPRCTTCSACTPRGCPDIAGDKLLPQLLGPARRDHRWMGAAFGLFATAFPGFVVGYFTAAAMPGTTVAQVYLQVIACALLSIAVAQVVIRLGNVPAQRAVPVLAGLAAAAYYLYVVPDMLAAFALPSALQLPLQLLTLALVVWWTVRAWRRETRRR